MRRSGSRRPPGQRTRSEYVLSEAEFNAFLARHLGRVAGLPLSNLAVSFVGGGIVELRGQLDLDQMAGDGVRPGGVSAGVLAEGRESS